MQNKIETIKNLFERWKLIKAQEKDCVEKRAELEKEILALFNPVKGTNRIPGVDGLKVTVRETVTYDQEILKTLAPTIEHFPFKVEYKPDSKGIEWTKMNAPNTWKKIMMAITTKMGKPSFSFEDKESKEEKAA